MKYSECPNIVCGQCMLQTGDGEDITEEEMKLECMEGYKTCPYSMFAMRRTKDIVTMLKTQTPDEIPMFESSPIDVIKMFIQLTLNRMKRTLNKLMDKRGKRKL